MKLTRIIELAQAMPHTGCSKDIEILKGSNELPTTWAKTWQQIVRSLKRK
jgi:hypothetical protein